MNQLSSEILQRANIEGIYNIYMYLSYLSAPAEHETLQSAVSVLEQKRGDLSKREKARLNILINAIKGNTILANSRISNLIHSVGGLTACAFTRPNGDVSVVFKGTGGGEWIDNGEGLSGMPEENTYITYGENGEEMYRQTVSGDYATDQQVEALNYFLQTIAKNNRNERTHITVSGHSKGGNKAQFVAIHSDLVDECYSFDGQGFSPEAISDFKYKFKVKYEQRRMNIRSFSAENDYVNVLGERLMPEDNIYYFKSSGGIHFMQSILDKSGTLRPQCEQGALSKYAESVSEDIMNLSPWLRQYATLGVMNIFQKHLGSSAPVNGDNVSFEKTIAGIGIAIGALLHNIKGIKKIYEVLST